jgi:hypothetical protein
VQILNPWRYNLEERETCIITLKEMFQANLEYKYKMNWQSQMGQEKEYMNFHNISSSSKMSSM